MTTSQPPVRRSRVVWASIYCLALFVSGGVFGTRDPRALADSLWTVGETGLQIQNIDPAQPARIRARFYDYDGALTHDLRRQVLAGAATNFYLPKIERDAGLIAQSYALVITSTRPVAAISRTEFRASGAAVMYSHVAPAHAVVVPLAMKEYVGQNSLISVQNTELGRVARVHVEWMQSGRVQPLAAVDHSLPPAGSVVMDPLRDPELAALPKGFVGWVRLASDVPITVQASAHVSTSDQAVAAFEGLPLDQASRRLYAPLVRRDWFGTTGISVVNPSPNTATPVTVTFHGTLGACVGRTYTQGPVLLPAAASAVFYQGPDAVPITGTTPLPEHCAGVAVLEAEATGIVAMVMDQDHPGLAHSAAAYTAVSDAGAARRVALPLVRNHHTKADLVTGIQVMNLDPALPATVSLQVIDSDGEPVPAGPDCSQTVPPLRSGTFYLPALASLAARRGMYGSAVLSSDRPLAVVAVDMSLSRLSDSVAFTGLPAELPPAPGGEAGLAGLALNRWISARSADRAVRP